MRYNSSPVREDACPAVPPNGTERVVERIHPLHEDAITHWNHLQVPRLT